MADDSQLVTVHQYCNAYLILASSHQRIPFVFFHEPVPSTFGHQLVVGLTRWQGQQ
jgi:hypothetical protein